MKLLFYTDNHFCEHSSILRRYGTKYSIRLENQIESVNWVQRTAEQYGCSYIFCLGDFYNTPELNEQEITASKDIAWSNITNYFIVGNHESTFSSLKYSSTKLLASDNRVIVSQPSFLYFPDFEILMLPYVTESDRGPLSDYAKSREKRIILSHNDISGIQYGMITSQSGYAVDEIEANCDCFVNGHLHNGQKITDKIINLGNLTGKDFGEDANVYSHNIMIFDTDTFTYELVENPYALNFYKVLITEEADFNKIDTLKDNAVVSIKCKEQLVKALQDKISNAPNIIESRVMISRDCVDIEDSEVDISDLTVDHLAKFVECCREKIENSAILDAELAEICK